MTETTYLGAAALGYLTDVGAAWSDLVPAERDDLLEQVHEHLNAVVAESGHDVGRDELVQRLGEPVQYADDLRTAAGLTSAIEPEHLSRPPAETLSQLAQRIHPVAAARSYVRRLQPAWWALRGYLTAGLVLPTWFGLPGWTTSQQTFIRTLYLHWYPTGIIFSTGRAFMIVPVFAVVLGAIVVGVGAEQRPTLGRRLATRVFDLTGVAGLVLLPTWWLGPLAFGFLFD